ncbi:MAG: LPS export ABC transporter periplasmic protein LptC [Methylococcales bacterium]|nr:LPS export ABC transporter periplasmic protein LptC [Methylococcales bacterium]
MKNLRNKKFYLTLTTAALVSWGLVRLIDGDEWQKNIAPVHSTDYFSNGYTKFEMNELGRLNKKLIADKVSHYSDDDTTHSVNPVMIFYKEHSPPWVIKSETGILSADGNNLLLNGKAIVSRAQAEGVTELTINTSKLRVQLDTSYAETDEWAELMSPPNITTGIGMKLVFVSPIHLELLANVKGKYETN